MYSKGLEITFTKYLSKEIKETDINSTSLFEDTLGTNGYGQPVIVPAEIRGRKEPIKEKIKNALRKVREMQSLPSLNDLRRIRGRKLFKKTKLWNEKRKVWIITF